MKLRLLTRPQLFVIAILILALGVAWSVYQDQRRAESGILATAGTVVSIRRDSLGCESRLPFAAKDCRFIVKIRHRPTGDNMDQTYLHVSSYHYLSGPSLAEGDAVTGTCTPEGTRGRCHFDQLEEMPQGLRVFLVIGALFLAVFALVFFRRRAPRIGQ